MMSVLVRLFSVGTPAERPGKHEGEHPLLDESAPHTNYVEFLHTETLRVYVCVCVCVCACARVIEIEIQECTVNGGT